MIRMEMLMSNDRYEGLKTESKEKEERMYDYTSTGWLVW